MKRYDDEEEIEFVRQKDKNKIKKKNDKWKKKKEKWD
jgi:hypothetical protein